MDIGIYRDKLSKRRSEIADRLRKIEGDLDTERNIDDDDRAIEREDQEVLEAVGEAGIAELKAIDAALSRIDHGSYGECAKCGKAISEKRLNALPQAALCMDCLSKNDEA